MGNRFKFHRCDGCGGGRYGLFSIYIFLPSFPLCTAVCQNDSHHRRRVLFFRIGMLTACVCVCIDRDLIYDPVESTEMPYPIIRRGFVVCECACKKFANTHHHVICLSVQGDSFDAHRWDARSCFFTILLYYFGRLPIYIFLV